jgi:hypothetical protein
MASFMGIEEDQTPQESEAPAWLVAADNHNLGNLQGGSWFDSETWGQKFENAGYMIASGMLSGTNSFYNTGITVANWFGAEAELRDNQEWISSFDSDMGEYYSQNRQAADLLGFVAGSIIPGLAGVKLLNAGQAALRTASATGLIGENLAVATGLKIPTVAKFARLAADDILNAQATFSAINANGIRALIAGVGQNVLEGVAFETAVQATMFKSPILEDQDGWDIVKNIAVGGALGGVIGGAFETATTLGAIKKMVAKGEESIKAFSSRTIAQEGASPAEKIILMTEDKELSMPRLIEADYDAKLKAWLDRNRRTDDAIRTEVHTMIPGSDRELGNMVADSIYGLDKKTTFNNLFGADQVARFNQVTKVEKQLADNIKTGVVDDTLSVSYVKLHGERAGVVSDTPPGVINLADRVAPAGKETTEELVKAEVKGFKFSPGDNWSIKSLSPKRGHFEAEARFIYASEILKELKPGTEINLFDIPMLERALKDGITDIKITDNGGKVINKSFTSVRDLEKFVIEQKTKAAEDLMKRWVLEGSEIQEVGTAAIAKITNVKISRLEGTLGAPEKDFFAWQSAKEDYSAMLKSKGLQTPAAEHADPRFLPSVAKVTRKAEDVKDLDGNVIDGMTYIKLKQKLLQQDMDRVVAKSAGELFDQLPELTDSHLFQSNRYGSGAGVASFANGGYGSLESITQQVGSVTQRLKQQFRKETADAFDGALVSVGNKQEAAIEFSTINQKVSRMGKQVVRYTDPDDGAEYLVTKDALRKYADEESGALDIDALSAEVPEELINIRNPEVASLVDLHIARSGSRTQSYRELRAVQGFEDVKDPEVFRPIRPNPNDYQFFAFVKDPSVTGQGHTTMIFAESDKKLAELIGKVPSKYKVFTKREVDEFKRARDEYEYSRTLNESYINSELKNRGIMSEFFTKTDPQKIVNDFLQQHLREDDVLAMELIRGKYQKQFDWLEDQGNAYTKVSASKFGSYSDRIEKAGKNPYLDYIKTSLDISKASENVLLYSFNKFLDSAVSRAVGNISDAWKEWKSPHDEAAMVKINKLLDEHGMNTGYRDAATDLLANHTAPKGELTKFIRGANTILAKLTLGLDPLNALNNAIGANILRGTELKQLTDAIRAGDTQLAGKLGELAKIKLPGVGDEILSPTKLVSSALKNFATDDHKSVNGLFQRYRSVGLIKDQATQFRDILEDFTLKGTETVGELNSRLSKAFQKAKDLTDKGEQITGNKLAEEFNRFISADVIRQLTDPAVEKGLITEAEQLAYMNTFVNRVEGITIASQRPLMFQGPIGQAVGLFQSYQFNLMQQMFRYVAEGTKKDAAMLLGLQGTFYGIQGLPGFQFMNQHIIGTASGNKNHTDLYDATYGIAGKQVGDLLMYGLPSNILQSNLYSRGDINPRQVTIIPTSIPDLPFVGAFGKFLGTLKETAGKISMGGNVWESLLQGIEHNGLSRPLAGLAQTLQATTGNGVAYSTTSKGNILFSNDLLSLATLTRLAGGRPLDEAIINDGVYRIQAYQQYDRARLQSFGEGVKSTMIEGQTPTPEQVDKFATKYAELGGKQTGFNKFMMAKFKEANTSQAQAIVSQLKNPFTQKMQTLMGGGSDAIQSLRTLSQPTEE